AAVALAKTCATKPADCARQASTAVRYADSNSADGISDVTVICGTAPGLSSCPAPSGNLSACVGPPPRSVPYVEVHTATEMPDGKRLLPPTFAALLTGNESYAGRTLHACARAAYGGPSTVTATAVTVSECEWDYLTANGSA